MPAMRLFSFASCIHIGITSFKNFSLAAFSVEMSKPIYCWAFCLVEISGNGTSSELSLIHISMPYQNFGDSHACLVCFVQPMP